MAAGGPRAAVFGSGQPGAALYVPIRPRAEPPDPIGPYRALCGAAGGGGAAGEEQVPSPGAAGGPGAARHPRCPAPGGSRGVWGSGGRGLGSPGCPSCGSQGFGCLWEVVGGPPWEWFGIPGEVWVSSVPLGLHQESFGDPWVGLGLHQALLIPSLQDFEGHLWGFGVPEVP